MSGTLNSIYNNVNFALHLHADALARLQEQASTGSRVNRASDDPSVAHRILGLNSQRRSLENYMDNISQAINTLEISSTIVNDITSAIAETKVDLTQITGGIYDQEGRERAADSINDTLEQMLTSANSRYTNQYLFGGCDTGSVPYVAERTNGEITSVTYQGSSQGRNIEVAPGLESSAFYVGDTIFCSDSRSAPVFLGDTGAKAGTGTSNVSGDVWLTVTGSAGNYDISIDDGLTTFNTDGTDTNLAVTDSRTGQVLYIDTTDINSTGVAMVRIPGTYDIFNTLISIRDLLRNERGLTDTQLTEAISSSISSLEEVRSHLTGKSVSIGSRIEFLDNLKDTLENVKFNTEDETTLLQQADIAQVAVDISRREVLYQMSLSVAGKLMSMSLLDFI
ncbi:MAG: flagellar hook-associated protein 3 [Planctomycetota bacterium]|nr:MAG: flagellar hook-associated protein 3 [Planctomycetota bacterium]